MRSFTIKILDKELRDKQQGVLVSRIVSLIASTPRDNQAANLIMILDCNRMSARLVDQEDDPEWYRDTYLNLAEVAETRGLFELRDRLYESSSLYADFIMQQACPLLSARQPILECASRGSEELQQFVHALQEPYSFSR